jgi:energy-coupling factor transport system substrate-specific component
MGQLEAKSFVWQVVFAVAAGILNFSLGGLVYLLEVPLYFDAIGTILIAIHLGLLPALLTALVTHLLLGGTGLILFPFVCCSIMTALIAIGFRYKGWLGNLTGYLLLGIALALANGIFGSVLSYVLFEGVTMVHAIDRLVMGIIVTGRSLLTSIFWAGMITNLMDKLLAVLLIFLVREPTIRLLEATLGSSKLEQGKPVANA